MFRKVATVIVSVLALSFVLTGCGGAGSSTEGTPEERGGNYTWQYISVAGNNYECLWNDFEYQTGSMDCGVFSGDKAEVEWSPGDEYTVDKFIKDGREFTCLWYARGNKTAAMSCFEESAVSSDFNW